MKVKCKNTYGDGTVEYVEYDIADPIVVDEDEDATIEDYELALENLGVSTNGN